MTDKVNTTLPEAVSGAVFSIFESLYQQKVSNSLRQAFDDVTRLYRGDYPGFRACDTAYHDIQHVLDVTLAMARLMDGYVRTTDADVVNECLFCFGILSALFHDCGYIRQLEDKRAANGAEYTRTHVSRGGVFLQDYLTQVGMDDFVPAAAPTLHFTGYEMPIGAIRVEPRFRLIGNLLGSADILAQMADRCYLEKCRDRLYPEFVSGGLARSISPEGREEVVFESAAHLIFKTPQFYQSARQRLDIDLAGFGKYAEKHFGGDNPYFAEVEKNVNHAREVAQCDDIARLRRCPPTTLMTR
ncbi:MAG: hypothetical protein V4637_13565 [Pseudomonadota bacterium]